MSGVDRALLDAARLGADDDVLVLGGSALALGAQAQLRDGWVYVVRHGVDELEAVLGEAHATGAAGIAYLVGEMPVMPLPDGAVAVAIGPLSVGDGDPAQLAAALAAAELARVLAAGGRMSLAESSHAAAETIAAALGSAGFGDVTVSSAGDEIVVSAART